MEITARRLPAYAYTWKAQLAEGAAGLFGGAPAAEAAPAVDLKSLHAKIGELTLENDFGAGLDKPNKAYLSDGCQSPQKSPF